MHISVRMTIHIIFGFRHAVSVRMTIHIILGFVMHISVRITIHIIFDFRHALCTNDYAYYFRFCHARLCTKTDATSVTYDATIATTEATTLA